MTSNHVTVAAVSIVFLLEDSQTYGNIPSVSIYLAMKSKQTDRKEYKQMLVLLCQNSEINDSSTFQRITNHLTYWDRL